MQLLADYQGFTNFEIVGHFVFVCHVFNDDWFPVHRLVTGFLVLSYSGVVPVTFSGGTFMFLTLCCNRADDLLNVEIVDGIRRARALQLVNTRFDKRVMCFVGVTQHIPQFRAKCLLARLTPALLHALFI